MKQERLNYVNVLTKSKYLMHITKLMMNDFEYLDASVIMIMPYAVARISA